MLLTTPLVLLKLNKKEEGMECWEDMEYERLPSSALSVYDREVIRVARDAVSAIEANTEG